MLFFFLYLEKSKSSIGIRIIFLNVLLNFILNSLVVITNATNATLYESVTLTEYLLFALFIWVLLKSKKAKLVVAIASLIYIIFYIIYSLLYEVSILTVSIPIGVEAILILIFSFYYLYEQMNDTSTLFIYTKPAFWIILGMVLYLAGSFFVYIFSNYLNKDVREKYWVITNVLSILKNIFFCIAIHINAKPPKESLHYDLELSGPH